jgi:hypothetical protein
MTEISRAQWRKGFRANVPASVALLEVESIHAEQGVVKPADVVNRARNKKNPLHPHFEWNDSRAAERHREDQARRLLRNLVIITIEEGHEQPISPAYVSVTMSEEEGSERGYVRISRAMNDEELRDRALQDALKMLNGLRRRYAALERLVEILDGVELQLKEELAV